MMSEPHKRRSPRRRFLLRLIVFTVVAMIVDAIALGMGAFGFHYFEGLDWLDASLNASLVMTGNGPLHHPQSAEGKLFVTLYAILGVILFAAVIGAFLTPVFQWVLHGLQRQGRNGKNKNEQHNTENG
ncbi:two pore domain potassium channel family protein [Gimesia aquarii]|uniref:Potassium channel domain-containing protein n=1 Tax=Gimesia aquarii TaxID=2527964 RepID=A0A517W201_9PLAN|nr:two pore domain potassium channel family protein [Gimesia aquarii]QDT99279.1 hypothetical protein V144x_47900 [Gimesia aquarii]